MSGASPAAILTADLHLDEFAWADRPQIAGDSQWAFQWICNLACSMNLPIVAAGDILDKRLNNAAVAGFVRRQLQRLPQPLLFIQGQHDMQVSPWLRELDDARAVWLPGFQDAEARGWSLSLGAHVLWGIDWTPADKLPDKIAAIPPQTTLLVMHQVCQEFMGQICSPELTAASLPHASLVLMGDYHSHCEASLIGGSGQSLQLLSPGSTSLREISEAEDKYVFLLLEDGSIRSVQIPTRRRVKSLVLDATLLDTFVEEIGPRLAALQRSPEVAELPEGLRKPLVHVKFCRELTQGYKRITEAVGSAGHLFLSFVASDALPDDMPADSEEQRLQAALAELGAVACLPLAVDAEKEPAVFNLCRRLLSEPDTALVLAESRKQYFDHPLE